MTSEAISMSTVDLSGLWRKSSRSGQGSGGSCVEVAFAGTVVAVRESKRPSAGTVTVPAAGWSAFLGAL